MITQFPQIANFKLYFGLINSRYYLRIVLRQLMECFVEARKLRVQRQYWSRSGSISIMIQVLAGAEEETNLLT